MAQTNVQAFSGKVGIGTNNPEYKLHVEDVANPRILLENTDTILALNQDIGSIIFKQNDSTGTTGTGIIGKIRTSSVVAPGRATFYGESANMIFSVGNFANDNANIDALTISGSGNVGIGTNNPKTRLNITSVSSKDDNMTSLRSNAAIRVDTAGDYNDFLSIGIFDTDTPDDNNPTGYIQHSWDSNSDSGRPFVINPAGGNVGIGTTDPGQKLSIYTGSTTVPGLSIDRYSTGNYRTEFYQANTGLAIHVGNGSDAPTEKMRIKHNGYVGIGTDDPSQLLDVYTGTASYGGIQVRTNTSPVAFAKLITNPADAGHNGIVRAGDLGIVFSPDSDSLSDSSPKGFYIAPWSSGTTGLRINDNGNVGIGTTKVDFRLDLGDNSGDCRLGFGENIGIDNNRGVYWSADGGYAIKRDSGPWSGPNYAQLRLQWATGIILDAGDGTYGRSYVGVKDRMAIGSSYYNSNTKPPDNGLLVQGNMAIATNGDGGHTLNVNGRAFANHLQAPNYFYVYTNIGADGNWRTAFNIGTTAIGFFTVLSNNAGYGQPSAIWWYQYKSGGTSGYVSRIQGSSTPTFRLSGTSVQSQGSGQQFVQVRTLPVSN